MRSRRCFVLVLCGLGACGVRTAGLGTGGAPGTGGSTAGGAGAVGSGGGGPSGGATAGRGAGGAGGAGAAETCQGGMTFTYVLRSLATIGPVTITGGGTTREIFGFDLDERDSTGAQPEDCGVIDGISADGRRGIDNTIAGLWAEDFAPTFQSGLANSTVVSTVRLSGVDSFTEDDCVDVTWSADVPQFRRAKIEGGKLIADSRGVVPLIGKATPINAFSPVTLVLPLSSPRISFRPTAQGLGGGVVGGSVTVDQLSNLYRTLFGSLVDGVMLMGFLHPDLPAEGSPCALLSAGFAFEATASPAQAD